MHAAQPAGERFCILGFEFLSYELGRAGECVNAACDLVVGCCFGWLKLEVVEAGVKHY